MEKIKTSLIIGAGEVGKSLYNVFKKRYENVELRDIGEYKKEEVFDVLHICFPYSKKFIRQVIEYKLKYVPKYTIIHSTVPVGTTKKCGVSTYFSPVRGVHPNLEKGLRTFVKYLAPFDKDLFEYFLGAEIILSGIATTIETLEMAKIMSTTYYGWNIVFQKEMWKLCKKHGIDYDTAYVNWNRSYNEGYEEMGMDYVKRPVLNHVKGKIGGHCIIPNCDLVRSEITEFIKRYNKKIKEDDN